MLVESQNWHLIVAHSGFGRSNYLTIIERLERVADVNWWWKVNYLNILTLPHCAVLLYFVFFLVKSQPMEYFSFFFMEIIINRTLLLSHFVLEKKKSTATNYRARSSESVEFDLANSICGPILFLVRYLIGSTCTTRSNNQVALYIYIYFFIYIFIHIIL